MRTSSTFSIDHSGVSSRQAISQHLDVLEQAGLAHTRRDGRTKFHHVDTAPLPEVVDRWPIPGGTT